MENIEITHRFNDMAWMLFIGPVCTIFVQGMAITIAILSDKSEQPVLPRWLGWFNLWAQIIYLPGILIPYFKSGPLAWNGLLAFWIPVVVFTVWLCLITAMLLRAINEQERAATHESAARPAASTAMAGESR
jgi:cytochrome c-type biogenesis protein CcmH/NrfF